MMGVTFASVGPMLSMAAAQDIGLLGIYGSVIAAGIFGILAGLSSAGCRRCFRRW
jgi:xanthine/uracil permease